MSKALMAVSGTTKLTKGQLALYELILEANREKFIIGRERLKMVYLNNVQRSPLEYMYWKPEGGYQPRSDYQTNLNCMTWFTNALGALIKKGYLTVIPKFNLADAKKLSE